MKSAIVAAALACAMSAQAGLLYNITYTDGGANVASGVIDVAGGLAISGTLNVTAGAASGSWLLLPGAGSDGSFSWDNAVNPASDPFLTSGGLLFGNGTSEVNLWGTGPGTYDFYGNIGGNWNPVSDRGVATIAPVPEPAAYGAIAGLGLLGFARWRRTRG